MNAYTDELHEPSQSSLSASARQIMFDNFANGKNYNQLDYVGKVGYTDRIKKTNPILLDRADNIILNFRGRG